MDEKIFTRDEFLALPDAAATPPEEVKLPGSENVIYVRVMSGLELQRFYDSTVVFEDKKVSQSENAAAMLIAATACDEKGNLLFTPEDAEKIGAKKAEVFEAILAKAQRVNAISVAARRAILKNLNETDSDDSVSD